MEQQKRGLCAYDDKRYLLADLPDGTPNPHTHAYGHYALAEEATIIDENDGNDGDDEDETKPGDDLIVVNELTFEQRMQLREKIQKEAEERRCQNEEKRMKSRNARALQKIRKDDSGGSDYNSDMPSGDENGMLHGADLAQAQAAAAARPGIRGRLGGVIANLEAQLGLQSNSHPPRAPKSKRVTSPSGMCKQ